MFLVRLVIVTDVTNNLQIDACRNLVDLYRYHLPPAPTCYYHLIFFLRLIISHAFNGPLTIALIYTYYRYITIAKATLYSHTAAGLDMRKQKPFSRCNDIPKPDYLI